MQVLISKEPTVAGKVAAHVAGLEDELGLLKRLDHPNIVRYLVSTYPSYPVQLHDFSMTVIEVSFSWQCVRPALSDM